MKHPNTFILLSYVFLISALSNAQTVHVVGVKDFVFDPANVDIAVGDTVEWQWINGTHTTTSDSTTGQNVWDAPIDAGHQVFRFVITAPGVHNYYCIYHPNMLGTITATPVNGVDNETNPLETGFDDRKDIYNLYALLVHLNLFGRGYLSSVETILNRF